MKSEGACKYCKKVLSAMAMSKHLLTCEERKKLNKEGNKDIFLIRASAGPFFVYFEIKGDNTLEDIDEFLRDLWLECCGHLSAFTINGTRYNNSDEDLEHDENIMNYKLSPLLSPNLSFLHEYDFGTTTELDMKVIEKRKGSISKIEILSRNNPPDLKCSCESEAKEICSQCEGELFCEKCAKKHACGEDMLLPVVNSPRMGMCGYTGDE